MRNSLLKSVAVAALLFSTPVSAADLKTDVQSDYKYLENLYKWFHANAELSFQEKNTSARLAKELRSIGGIDVTTNVGGYGVVGVVKNGAGPTLMIRADMDGLPIEELTGLSYASKNMGVSDDGKPLPVMHGCGHDVHVTSLVGAARQLMKRMDEWSGTLVLIGQPAEERISGAKAMLDDGLFERFPLPDYNIALHVEPSDMGDVTFVEGYALANVDTVDILVRGISGHGSAPHVTKDPIVIASQIVLALQTLVSREISPRETGVVTVGSFHAGLKHNIIGEEAKLQLTVRSYSDDARKTLKDGIKRISENMGRVAGLPEDLLPVVTFIEKESTPSTYNNPEFTKRVRAVVAKEMGDDHVYAGTPAMAGEDFAYFGRTEHKIPSLTFGIGGISDAQREKHRKAGTPVPGNHSSFFAPDPDGTLQTGVRALTAAALDILAKK